MFRYGFGGIEPDGFGGERGGLAAGVDGLGEFCDRPRDWDLNHKLSALPWF